MLTFNDRAFPQVPVGAEVTAVEAIGEGEAGTRLGRVTSVTTTPDDTHHALAYLKCKSKGKQVDLAGMMQATASMPTTGSYRSFDKCCCMPL